MINTWIDKTSEISPPRDRVIIAYCPKFNSAGYEIVKWNGYIFESEFHGMEVNNHVEEWCLFMEAD